MKFTVYFSIDSFGIVRPTKLFNSAENVRAKNLLESSTKRIGERFETGLLWKYDEFQFPESSSIARRRLGCF